ncbi:hypothetical protein ABZU76_02910 [Amycolatopsis sp. NPDC005232]|uniref:hypothetical protein n=1 Tax=Amycolatopsis sp. NPDC005232 TaxID=3157027 RepID=UPI0033BE039D
MTTPTYTVTRLEQLVTAYLAQVRAGALTLDEAEQRITAAFTSLAEQQVAAAALRDAEVTGNREGIVSADPAATSARAAQLVVPRSGTQRARLLDYIVTAPAGVTDFEAERDLGLLGNAVRPRRNELVAGGYVIDSGKTRRHRGTEWSIWLPTAEGLSWYSRRMGGAA